MAKAVGKAPLKMPPSLKGGGKTPPVKGYAGDNSSKKQPMKSANSTGKGTVKKAREARLTKAGY